MDMKLDEMKVEDVCILSGMVVLTAVSHNPLGYVLSYMFVLTAVSDNPPGYLKVEDICILSYMDMFSLLFLTIHLAIAP